MKVPRDMDDAKALGKVLSKYKDTFYVQVLVAYFATYILYPFNWKMFSTFVQEKDFCKRTVQLYITFSFKKLLMPYNDIK